MRTGLDLLAWGWNFFSIGYFAPRLFFPWHRDLSGYGRGFDLKRIFHVLGWNMISRVLGAIMRLTVMIFGIVVEVGLVVCWTLIIALWFAAPLAAPLLILNGFRFLLL